MPNILAFDIETVPDVDGGRRLYALQDLEDSEVAQIMFAKQRDLRDTEFLPLHMHRVLVISIVLRTDSELKVWSLGNEQPDEKATVSRFFDGIERYSPTLVSWNGSGFDLPVLNYRSLVLGVQAPRYWDVGDGDRDFRWNNYVNRYHYRHTDLMDVLAGFQPRASAPLDQVSVMCGLPGKLGMDGSKVWEAYREGRFADIRDYCETDVLNTYLLYLRWEFMRGHFTLEQLKSECERVRAHLEKGRKPHFERFLEAWDRETI
jgi:predicted PolB exonuclease-like 3'-5' exonuclease